MIEDFIDNPRGELRWLSIAWLMLVAIVSCVWLIAEAAVAVGSALQGGNNLPIGAFLASIVQTANLLVLRALFDPIIGIFLVVAVFVARNFLRAFEDHRPRLLCALGVMPMLFIAPLPSGDVWAGAGLAVAGLVWVRLLPAPGQDASMSPVLRGATVGFACGVFILYLGGILAALRAGRLLLTNRGAEAAAVGIAAGVPAIPVAMSFLVNGGPSIDNIAFAAVLVVLLVEATAGVALETDSPPGPEDERDSASPRDLRG